MCKDCAFIEDVFIAAKRDGSRNYAPVLAMLDSMITQERIVLYMGDCKICEAEKTLVEETHTTVRLYFQCLGCGKVYYIGMFIRGPANYDVYDSIDETLVEKSLWGREGDYFHR